MPPRTPSWSRFQVLKHLGSGSEGETHLLEDKQSGVLVVRKTATSFKMAGDIPREVKILKGELVQHPRIIELLDYQVEYDSETGHLSGRLRMYFDFCAGGDLGRYQVGRTDEGFLWHVLKHMAEALAYLHEGFTPTGRLDRGRWQRVVHCDIKPDNILLVKPRTSARPYPDVVLGDFGFATLEEVGRSPGAILYQPPEFPMTSPLGDVWSLGASIHEMAHGRPPLDEMSRRWRGSRKEWVEQPEAKNPQPLSQRYSMELNEIMMECLEVNAVDRISSVELVQQLRRSAR